jgi:hypothetical protein
VPLAIAERSIVVLSSLPKMTENMNDYSGYSISTAGDVNGDGLDDLIVSAHVADSNGKVKAGKSYVIFIIQAIAIDIACVRD